MLGSNGLHQDWLRTKVVKCLQVTAQPVVSVLGLTYKPGTSTLRRSLAIELCQWLHQRGVCVQAHDPVISVLPDELQGGIKLCNRPCAALSGADLAIITTEWPDYRKLHPEDFIDAMRQPQIIDQNWFLSGLLANDQRINYVATGRLSRS